MIPDKMKIKFYKIQLRTEDDDDEYMTSKVFTDSGGKEIVLIRSDDSSTGVASSSVVGSVLELGVRTYNYLYLEISNRLGIKNVSEFIMTTLEDSSMSSFEVETTGNKDWSGDAVFDGNGKLKIPGTSLVDPSNNTRTTGYFYTRGQTTSLSGSRYRSAHGGNVVNFGNSNKTPAVATDAPNDDDVQWDYEIIDNFSDDPDSDFSENSGSIPGPGGVGVTTAKLLQNNGTLATTNANASRIGITVNFPTPIEISESTTSFNLVFFISDSLCAEFNRDTSNNIIPIKFGANPFYVKVSAE